MMTKRSQTISSMLRGVQIPCILVLDWPLPRVMKFSARIPRMALLS